MQVKAYRYAYGPESSMSCLAPINYEYKIRLTNYHSQKPH